MKPTFTDSQFCTADEKMKVYKGLIKFIDGGMRRPDFTKAIYNRLTLDFSHIAHYNIHGFYETWCYSQNQRVAWIEHLLEARGYNDSAELVNAVKAWLKATNQLDRYRKEADTARTELIEKIRSNPEGYADILLSR